MEEFNKFLINMFKQLSNGDFAVSVICGGDKEYSADVIGYSKEKMTVNVRFHTDSLTKPGTKKVPIEGFPSGMDFEQEYDIVEIQVPVKEENIYWKSIMLKADE